MFSLHPYQRNAIAQIEATGSDICLTLPTGTGKSVTAIALIDRLIAKGGRVLVCVPYTPLISQFREEILQFFPHLAPHLGIYAAEFSVASRRLKPSAKIIIAMMQTIEARCIKGAEDDGEYQTIITEKAIPGGDFTHIILDEAHLSAFRMGYTALKTMYANARFIYLTATPYRDDGGRFPPATKFIQTITVNSAIEAEYLADYEIYPMLPEGMLVGVDAESYTSTMSELIGGEMLATHYKENSRKRKSLFIFPDKAALNYYLSAFRDADIHPMIVVDSTRVKERESIFARFKNEVDAVIFSVNVLCAGCNLPHAEDLYLMRSPGLATLTQIGGRVLRRHGSKVARIYDCFNSYLRLPTPKSLPPWEKLISENTQGRRCKGCGRINPADSEWCLDCGKRVKRTLSDGDLEQLAIVLESGVGLLSDSAVGTPASQFRKFGAPLVDCNPSQSTPERAFAFFKQRCFLRTENPKKVFVLMRQSGFNYAEIQRGARSSRSAIFASVTVGSMWLYDRYLREFNLPEKERREILEQEFPSSEVTVWLQMMPK